MPSPLDRLSRHLDSANWVRAQTWLGEARALLAEVRTEQEHLSEGWDKALEIAARYLDERNKATAQVAALAGDRERLREVLDLGVRMLNNWRNIDAPLIVTDADHFCKLGMAALAASVPQPPKAPKAWDGSPIIKTDIHGNKWSAT